MSRIFVDRFLKPEERHYFNQLPTFASQTDYLATLWAIKESCVKAWPSPSSIFHFTVRHTPTAYILVKPNDYKCKISVTNDKQSVIAICLVESKEI